MLAAKPRGGVVATQLESRRRRGHALLVVAGALLFGGCTTGPSPSVTSLKDPNKVLIASSGARLGATAKAARAQKWNCPRIEKTIENLIPTMQTTKQRAEKEQEQAAPTLERMFARVSGPLGAGNTALAEFQKARDDVDQLNDLLGEKGCKTYPVGVDAPAFLKR